MTTSNHMLTGSIIALALKNPLYVLPAAFLSHFVLDMLPHFGNTDSKLNSKQLFRKYLSFEIFGSLGIVVLLSTGSYGLNLMTSAAMLSILPDIEWPVRYLFFASKGKQPPATFTAHIHKRIQWCEREWAAIIEILFFIVGFILFKSLL